MRDHGVVVQGGIEIPRHAVQSVLQVQDDKHGVVLVEAYERYGCVKVSRKQSTVKRVYTPSAIQMLARPAKAKTGVNFMLKFRTDGSKKKAVVSMSSWVCFRECVCLSMLGLNRAIAAQCPDFIAALDVRSLTVHGHVSISKKASSGGYKLHLPSSHKLCMRMQPVSYLSANSLHVRPARPPLDPLTSIPIARKEVSNGKASPFPTRLFSRTRRLEVL
jgi:hypothetical protein